MFQFCKNLISPPELPATNLEYACYLDMFMGCRSLIASPHLEAETIPNHCYQSMFGGCTSLAIVYPLGAETLGCYSCEQMYESCYQLEDVTDLLENVTSVNGASCEQMFANCINLRVAPDLLASRYVKDCEDCECRACYEGIFQYCRKLEYVKIMLSQNLDIYDPSRPSLGYRFPPLLIPDGTNGTIVKPANIKYVGIPEGWTVQDA